MTDINILPATAQDIPAIQSIVEATGLFPPEMAPDMIAGALSGDSDTLWHVAGPGSQITGFTMTEAEAVADRVWNMRAIGVAPDHQTRGVGAALVAGVEQNLRDAGQRLIVVDTSDTDGFAGARAFYTALGYAEVARIPDFWEQGDAKVTFSKML